MFANIRRHQKWLWILISAAVIISFVWYFNPNQRNGGGRARFDNTVGSINGRSLTRGEYMDAQREAHLRYFLNYGSWYGTDEFSRQNEGFVERETKNRLILKEKIKEYNIFVTPKDVAEWMADVFGRERPFSTADYERFIQTQLAPKGIRESDFERFGRTEVGIMHLLTVAGLPGKMVTPQEAETHYKRENEKAQADIVVFSSSNFLARVNMNDTNAIMTTYTNRMGFYRIQDKRTMAYVEFAASNYFASADQKLAAITNLNQLVEQVYMQRGTNFYTDTNGMALGPEAAKKKIVEQERTKLALVEAQKAATEFAEAVFSIQGPKLIANLEATAVKSNLVVKTTEPFAQFESPRGMDVPEQFAKTAFALTPEEPFIEEPIRGDAAVYVTGLKDRIPGSTPPFEAVRERVLEDYKTMQSRMTASTEASVFYGNLTNAMASRKQFTEAATQFGGKVTTLGAFNQNSRTIEGLDPRIDPGQVKRVAFELKEGETSSVLGTQDGAFVLHVNKFIPVSDADWNTAKAAFITSLQRARQSDAFQEWFIKQAQATRVTILGEKSEEGAAAGKK